MLIFYLNLTEKRTKKYKTIIIFFILITALNKRHSPRQTVYSHTKKNVFFSDICRIKARSPPYQSTQITYFTLTQFSTSQWIFFKKLFLLLPPGKR